MAYNFKNLADVELLSAMPESANVLVEVDGATKRAPQAEVDVAAELVAKEALEEVPEGAEVLGVVNGEIKRIPGAGLGGGKALIVKSSDFDNAMAGVAAALAEAAPEVTYTANMTFNEMMEAFAACELIGGFVFVVDSVPMRAPIVFMNYDTSTYTVPCMVLMAFSNSGQAVLYWTSDSLSTTEPELAEQPK